MPAVDGTLIACPCAACTRVRYRLLRLGDRPVVVCPRCGQKRCPHALDHRIACQGFDAA